MHALAEDVSLADMDKRWAYGIKVSVRRSLLLTDVLGSIADHKINRIDDLLPWRYALLS